MSQFPIHTLESAPEAARETLRALQRQLGAVPNLAAAMAGSPALLKGFVVLRGLLYDESSFTPLEVQVLALSNAFENRCRYCMALHSTLALKEGLSAPSVVLLREGRAPLDPRLAALSDFARELARRRGHVDEAAVTQFIAAGFTPAQVLEVVLAAAVSLLPNYAHHLTGAPLDAPFQTQAWAPPVETARSTAA